MACGCPAWKDYRDTEEVCDLPISEGSIYFVDAASNKLLATTFYLYGDVTTGASEAVDDDRYARWSTDLPNPELGTWSYVFLGTWLYTIDPGGVDSIDDMLLYELNGTPGNFYWACQVENLDISDPPNPWMWTGDLEVYYDLEGIQYGPLIVSATRKSHLI